jgi:hypothetical protein
VPQGLSYLSLRGCEQRGSAPLLAALPTCLPVVPCLRLPSGSCLQISAARQDLHQVLPLQLMCSRSFAPGTSLATRGATGACASPAAVPHLLCSRIRQSQSRWPLLSKHRWVGRVRCQTRDSRHRSRGAVQKIYRTLSLSHRPMPTRSARSLCLVHAIFMTAQQVQDRITWFMHMYACTWSTPHCKRLNADTCMDPGQHCAANLARLGGYRCVSPTSLCEQPCHRDHAHGSKPCASPAQPRGHHDLFERNKSPKRSRLGNGKVLRSQLLSFTATSRRCAPQHHRFVPSSK